MKAERVLALAAWLAAGCSPPSSGPPPIAAGTGCAACGMGIQDLRYAATRRDGRRWLAYDSIECLLRDAPAGAVAWLADYDSRALHAADSMWVVRGDFPSPMGGGYAAFRDREAAEDVAGRTRGHVDRLGSFRVSDAQGRP